MAPLRTAHDADAALIERTRHGDRSAFAELWERHAASGRTVARSFSSLDPDDLVSESFTRIYDAILSGKGPTAAFRPYLFTTIRNTAASWGRARHETNLETLESFEDPETSESATLDALDRSTTAQAFRSLPTRWQEVLWYSEVEGMTPQQIAPLVGMSANSTAALAYRAREGLRQAWIQAHLKNATEPECRWTIDRLGAYTRGKLRTRDTTKLESHLDDCARCTIVAAEAREVGSRLALVLLPLAAGIGGATAYAGWLSQGVPAADYAMGATGAAAAGVAGAQAASGAVSGATSGTGAASAAGAGSAASTGGMTGTGIAIGAGAAVVAAVVAAAVILPALTASQESGAAPAIESEAIADVPESVALPGTTAAGVTPPSSPRGDAPDASAPDPTTPGGTTPTPPTGPNPTPGPGTTTPPTSPPTSPPTGPPGDTVALPPSVTVDTAGGLAQPIVNGTAEAGASVTIAGAGTTWSAVAGSSGAFSIELAGLPAGRTDLAVTQTDVAGNVSAPARVGVDLAAPRLLVDSTASRRPIITLSGASASTVEIDIAGVWSGTVGLGGGRVELRGNVLSLIITMKNPAIDVRYVVDGRVGPWASATYVG